MSSERIHLVHRVANSRSEYAEPRLSITPLSDPAQILRRIPAQAISPALLELLDVMSGPILLFENNPAGECRETAPAMPLLCAAAPGQTIPSSSFIWLKTA
jgi:hypothetical protein